MGKEPVIPERDAHGGSWDHKSKHRPLEPVLLECYDVPWNNRDREKEGSNQEYACDPIDPLEGNAEF